MSDERAGLPVLTPFQGTKAQLLARISTTDKRKFGYLVTPNVDHLRRIEHDAHFAECYRQAELIVNDSRVIDLLGNILGFETGLWLPGSDLTRYVLAEVVERGESVMLIGGDPDAASKVSAAFGLDRVEQYRPPMGFIEVEAEVQAVVEQVKAAEPVYIAIAVGSPRQEKLALRLKREETSGFGICVGASIDYITGGQKRAPYAFRVAALEWLYRWFHNPQRLSTRVIYGAKWLATQVLSRRLADHFGN